MPMTLVRDTQLVLRPARETARAETWRLTVIEKAHGCRSNRRWYVQAVLLGEHHPEAWDVSTAAWVPAHTKLIPGVHVPAGEPTPHKSLGQARKDAQRLSLVLSGRMTPGVQIDHEQSL